MFPTITFFVNVCQFTLFTPFKLSNPVQIFSLDLSHSTFLSEMFSDGLLAIMCKVVPRIFFKIKKSIGQISVSAASLNYGIVIGSEKVVKTDLNPQTAMDFRMYSCSERANSIYAMQYIRTLFQLVWDLLFVQKIQSFDYVLPHTKCVYMTRIIGLVRL